ncbi:EAL domain-containing protein [Cellvibrio sp. KY-GH-1]|uniref:putative bifunctional diguanylate cyclase/phosphodiesterase n=1 Tax=Cellvibrio sp. KY-GH-1 TaxID=2303332 RepID=UPI00124547AE|nr:EAL domain-containing protein [Cellvibrio sp. KY-GH-1]QEY15269.1 EAL domain-containing protein [Cellvibrio sp. KY-GH-1]
MSQEATMIPKILVVDDRSENLIAMRHILSKIDGEIVCADSGNEALRLLLHYDFAVVLMDVQMPDMNGFETAELIRGNEATRALPIIFVTAINKEKQYVQQGYELGAVDYLFKPFDPQILRYKVSVFAELFRQRYNSSSLAQKNQLILDSVNEGVLGLNVMGEIIFGNPSAARLLQIDRKSLDGQNIGRFIKGFEDRTWESTEIYRLCVAGRNYSHCDHHFLSHQGESFPVELTATAMTDAKGKQEGFVLVFNDISARLRAEHQLAQLAEYDPLTGLANRRLFYRLLPKILAKAKRLEHEVGLLFIDIDHFKAINDTLGHVIGDLLLSQVAARLKASVRDSDTVVRLSGDEFTAIIDGEFVQKNIEKLASNIIEKLAQPYELNNNLIHCTVSVGIAIAPQVAMDANELIKAADIAMYSAKAHGRNNFQFYDETLSKQVSYRAQVETRFQRALEQEEFHLVYQPKINMESGKVKGFETLIRWNSPSLGVVSPAVFIPIAEDCGRINEIGDWVFKNASLQLEEWSRQGMIDKDFRLAVNFSTKQLNNPGFLSQLEKVFNEARIDPMHLEMEITETTLMSNPSSIVPLLRILSQMGITISVDDFGTGYSSLNYLKILPIHVLKIDQSFIKDLFRDTNSEIITRSIINLAHNLDLRVVAEGVETQEQNEFLLHHGCDFGQGYLYGKPQQAKDAQGILLNQNPHIILLNPSLKKNKG